MIEIPSGLRLGGILALYLNPINSPDGTITGVACRTADITALKQLEAQLRFQPLPGRPSDRRSPPSRQPLLYGWWFQNAASAGAGAYVSAAGM